MASRKSAHSAPRAWQLHEAKAQFSKLFRQVRDEGPQRVVKQGGESVVIVPAEEFDRLMQREAQPQRLVDFFRDAPSTREALVIGRKADRTRHIDW
jgi:prevent-host-death family protein